MRGKVTKRSVEALTPGPDGTESVLWDSELRGFGVRVQRGGVRSYVLQYRAGDQRGAPLRKLTIGRHGAPWTPEAARREARRLLGAIAHGTDPAAARAERREAPTMADLAQRFLSEHAEAKRKPSTAAEYRRLIDKVILPALGTRRVADVTRAEIAKLHHGLRDVPYQANRVLAVLAALPRIEGNPFVIVGHRAGAPLVNLEKPWRAIRATAGLDDVRLHDLRHAFASIAASSGLGLPIIGNILGHTQPATTARYAHLASDPVKAAAAAKAVDRTSGSGA